MKFKLFLEIILLSILIIGCGKSSSIEYRTEDPDPEGGDGTTNNPRFDETYEIPDDYSTTGYTLFTEYEKYFFKTNETRDIYIRGTYTEGSSNYVWYYNPSNNNEIKEISIGTAPNAFIDETNNYFVCPISIEVKNNISDWSDVEFYVGVQSGAISQTSLKFDIEKINESDDANSEGKREMKVHYACLASNDIRGKVYFDIDPEEAIKEAFKECNTEIIFENVNTGGTGSNILTEPSPSQITYSSAVDQRTKLDNYFIENNLIRAWGDPNNLLENKVYLIAMSSFTTSDNTLNNQIGVTFSKLAPDGNGDNIATTAYCVVWEDNTFSIETYNNAFMIAGVATHELGHGRGGLLRNSESYVPFLTNNDEIVLGNGDIIKTHEAGHNGIHKKTCILRYKENMDAFPDEKKVWISKPLFCEGHKQMLLNVNWTETEAYHD